ncbi:VIT domain-containing protein [Bernardetia sp. ABR2-2B]|uniref:VIT domain-containing protein n=1 Tax=Bernardetia sp. ABR2-2B TaxID=3127472 RepID=UPI0030CE1667
MKHNLHKPLFSVFFYLTFFISVFAQKTDDLGKLSILQIKNDSAFIELESVDIEVEILGNRATTVTKLTFYNPNDRVLEGELNFPLADKQRVFRFAMDLNGKLREGVVVEKELGRRAFEGVIRKEIDPALLEMTVGNNYKARVYPIPAKGRKIILIGYEEELQDSKAPLYQLNLKYGKVKNFDLNVKVINQEEKPKVKQNELSNFKFKKWETSYIAKSNKKNFEATGIFSFEIPTQINEKVFREKSNSKDTESDYFYINLIPNVIQKDKILPSSIAVLWDVSHSSKERKTEKEIALLESYLERINQKKSDNSLNLKLILFNNRIVSQNDFLIDESNFENQIIKIKRQLESIVYDGGTDLKAIDFPSLEQNEILLFSDGISNLSYSDDAFPLKKDNLQTIYTIVSSGTNDAPFLNSLAQKTGGNYINLSYETQKEAVEALLSQNYQFLGAKYKNRILSEVYPITPQTLQKNKSFSLAGKISADKDAEIEIQFGIGKQVLETRKITIPKNYNSTSIQRIWANKKVDEFSLNTRQNKTKIVEVAKNYSLITPYTSLIVLDRIEDYVKYEISPPAELKEEYEKLLAQKTQKIASTETEIIKIALADYEEKIEWWTENKKDSLPEQPKKTNQTTTTTTQTTDENNTNSTTETITENLEETQQEIEEVEEEENNSGEETENQTTQNQSVSVNQSEVLGYERNKTITGVISSIEGTLPGATVQIKGTTIRTQTDIDGNYSIVCSEKDILVFRFVGFSKREALVGNQSIVDVIMTESSELLESVVVTGMAIEEKSQSLGYAVQTIQSEQLVQSIQGNAAGVQINGNAGSSSNVVIRGNSSVNLNAEPLYVVDGIPMEKSDYSQINPEQVKSVSMLKNENATALYGSKGANGVIIVITKKAAEKGYVLPDSTQKALQIQQKETTKLVVKEWSADEPYMDSIKNATKENRFETYLSLKESYSSTPSFFLSVGSYFIQNGEEEVGVQILSNIVELELENYELLKMLGYKYSELGKMETAIFLFEKVKELRPNEPHSYRDLALTHQKNGNYQKALDLFYEVLIMDFDKEDENWDTLEDLFPYFKSTVLTEFNNLIALHKDKLDLSKVNKKIEKELSEEQKNNLFKNTPVDIRVVLDWNTLETDIDLWIIEPTGEKTYYSNNLSQNGGRLTEDLTDGYGSEEYILKEAIKGEYIIKVDFYDDRTQKIAGASTLKATIYFNYGSKNQTQKEIIFQLESGMEENDDEIEIGRFEWKK